MVKQLKKNKILSIIIPTRNEGDNIERCLKSIPKVTNVETIVVDNYSTDTTKQIARKYTKHVYNYGPERSAQRNFGASKSSGKILLFLDADMEFKNTKLIDEICTLKNTINSSSYIIPEISIAISIWDKYRAFYRKYLASDYNIEAARVFSKRNFIKVNGYDPKLNACEDWDLHSRISNISTIKKLNNHMLHHESISNIFSHLKKKFYYATYLNKYASKPGNKLLSPQTLFFLRPSFYGMIKELKNAPVNVIGATILLIMEALSGLLGFTYGKYFRK